MSGQQNTKPQHEGMPSYLKLGITLVVSFVIMYLLTFSMINIIGDFYFNISNAYMVLMMVFPMAIVMLIVMWGMFTNKKLNIALIAGFLRRGCGLACR